MSECGFCLYGDADVFFHDQEVNEAAIDTAAHECCECGRSIETGKPHQLTTYFLEHEDDEEADRDVRERCYTCTDCAAIRKAFYCEGQVYWSLWDDMSENFEQLTTACLARLKDSSAREYLRSRWMDWKGMRRDEVSVERQQD